MSSLPAAPDQAGPTPSLAALRAALGEYFGYPEFRTGQAAVIGRVLGGQDVLAIMPTGAGKSLCYQLPAMLLPGCTLVISPLLALMKDQLDSLPAPVHARTTVINSSLEPGEIRERVAGLAGGRYKLVYATPERLRQAPFLQALKQARVSLLVVDEAHCLSLWGHDFRPDYLFLRTALGMLGEPRVLAMTATATPEMQVELRRRLERELELVTTGVLRENLFLQAETVRDNEAKLRTLVQFCREQQAHQRRSSGIVYVSSRERADQLALLLRRSGVMALAYHAGLAREERERVQNAFMLDTVPVIVATVAFGMGVDKANVRYVVHFNPARSLEAYAQESGRAGRDGQPAHCLLLMTAGDRATMRRWLADDVIPIGFLRAVYAALKRERRGPFALLDPARVASGLSEDEGRSHDETEVRVAISLLERAGLVRRHLDLPRQVRIEVGPGAAGSEEIGRLVAALGGSAGGPVVDSLALAERAGLEPARLETRLLDWQEQGWLHYRPLGRQALVELLPPPADAVQRVEALVEQWQTSQEQRLDLVLAYAGLSTCRHAAIARHFGLSAPPRCGACDNCAPAGSAATADAAPTAALERHPADLILECVGSLPFGLGRTGLARVLRGSVQAAVKVDRCRNFGALASLPISQVEREIERLIEQGYLARDESEYRRLSVTQLGREKEPEPPPPPPSVPAPRAARPPSPVRAPRGANRPPFEDEPGWDDEAEDRFERLRSWRRIEASRQALPPYVIFHDATLRELAARRPTDDAGLARIKGFGAARLERYGADVLALLRDPADPTVEDRASDSPDSASGLLPEVHPLPP